MAGVVGYQQYSTLMPFTISFQVAQYGKGSSDLARRTVKLADTGCNLH
jgi:hypothetical protein